MASMITRADSSAGVRSGNEIFSFPPFTHLAGKTCRCNFEEIRLYKRPMNTEQVEEIKRHFGVVADSLRSDIRQIAEGHATIRHELHDLRGEFRDEFKEMRALIRLSFSQLDQRLRTLESDISTLKARMDRLETSRA
jgi:hypothetical protein